MLSKGDAVSAGTTLVLAGVTYFAAGRTWAFVCIAVGVTILIVVHYLRGVPSETSTETPPVSQNTFAPVITQNANPVITVHVDPSPSQNQSTAPAQSASPSLQARPKLEVIGKPSVMPVGYDPFGVWKVGIGEAQGALLAIRNATAKMGEKVGPAHDLAASLEFKDRNGSLASIVSRAHWLGKKGNQITLGSGETATILLAVIENGCLFTYENPCKEAPVFYTRGPRLRSVPQYRGHPVPLAQDISLTVRVVDCEEGETMLEHEITIAKEMGELRFA